MSVEQLCELLEADVVSSNLPRSINCKTRRPASFVSYEVFRKSYWPHFPQPLTKRLGKLFFFYINLIDDLLFSEDSSLVFSEFMGVIQGSELTLTAGKRYLDQSTYESLSHRSHSILLAQRSAIYAIFEIYLKRKKMNGQYDAADR